MALAKPGTDLRPAALLLTLAFWAFHVLLIFSRSLWLSVPPEALAGRVASQTASGLMLCALLYLVIERGRARPLAALAALVIPAAIAAGLANAAVPIADRFLVTATWHPDSEPSRFLTAAIYWSWVFLAWSAVVAALAFRLAPSTNGTEPDGFSLNGDGALWLPHRGQRVRVALRDIVRFEAAGDYVVVHTAGCDYLTHASLRSLEQRLDPSAFARVHRGAIVRLDAVSRIERSPTGLLRLHLDNGDVVSVSRTCRRRLGDRLAAR